MRAFHVDACTVLHQDPGKVGLVDVESPIEGGLRVDAVRCADRPVQLAAAVDQTLQHLLEVGDGAVHTDGDVERRNSSGRIVFGIDNLNVG